MNEQSFLNACYICVFFIVLDIRLIRRIVLNL